jgi:hypothetical protein
MDYILRNLTEKAPVPSITKRLSSMWADGLQADKKYLKIISLNVV